MITQNLYIFTVMNAEINDANKPFVPIYVVEIPPSTFETANIMNPTILANITLVVLITLFLGILRFILSAKQRAVVAATNKPTTPIE